MNRTLREFLGVLHLTQGFTIRFDLKGTARRPIINDPTMIFLPAPPNPYLDPDGSARAKLVIGGETVGSPRVVARIQTIVRTLNDRRLKLPGDYHWTIVEQTPIKRPLFDMLHGIEWHTMTFLAVKKPPELD